MKSLNALVSLMIILFVFIGLQTPVFAQSNHGFQKLMDERDPENKMAKSIDIDSVMTEEEYELDTTDGWDIFRIRKAIARKKTKGLLKDMNLQGNLPKGSNSFVHMSRNTMKCGVNVFTSTAHVKIDVYDLKGNLIATLVDDELLQGWNNYKWTRGDHPKGKYQLSISVDDQIRTQYFKLK